MATGPVVITGGLVLASGTSHAAAADLLLHDDSIAAIHAQKVLRCLGVEQHFPQVFDITFTHFIPKPNPEPYNQVLKHLCLDGRECMMIEDLPANLQPAKELGMTTVLVGEIPGGIDGFVDYEIQDILKLSKVLQMLRVDL